LVPPEKRVIRLACPHIDDDDIAAVTATLRSGHLVQGPQVAAFESQLSAFLGGGHVVAMNSCTSALHLALLALNVQHGDEVIVPTYSWPATANVVVRCGATPVFVDIEETSFAMNPDRLAQAIPEHPRAKAIVPVHPFGEMADMAMIADLAAKAGIPIIEDAACALGACFENRYAGRLGLMGCYSFHPRKAITTAEGGAVVTDDSTLARRLRMLRNHGLDPDASAPDFVLAGLNQRMTEVQAALGRSQMRKLATLIASRRRQAAEYDELFAASQVRTPVARGSGTHVFQSYVVLIPEDRARERDTMIRRLREAGIEASIGTHHIPLQRYYRETFGYRTGDFPVTDRVAGRALALPLHAYLTPEEQGTVVEVLRTMTD
jgi:perosamine synthetase